MPLIEAVRTSDRQKAIEWSQSAHWATIEQLISATSGSSGNAGSTSQGTAFGNNTAASSFGGASDVGIGPGSTPEQAQDQSLWTCNYCTFHNQPELSICEMCRLPRYT